MLRLSSDGYAQTCPHVVFGAYQQGAACCWAHQQEADEQYSDRKNGLVPRHRCTKAQLSVPAAASPTETSRKARLRLSVTPRCDVLEGRLSCFCDEKSSILLHFAVI